MAGYSILSSKILANYPSRRIVQLKVYAPLVAENARPGQFVIIMVEEKGERIPLTIVDVDKKNGLIFIVVQEVGFTSSVLARKKRGEKLFALLGPLGQPTVLGKEEIFIGVGGGVGIAELLPVVKYAASQQKKIICFLGAKTKELLIYRKQISSFCHKTFISTEDGSLGYKGLIIDQLKEFFSSYNQHNQDMQVYGVGPIVFLEKLAQLTSVYKIRTTVCLTAIMVDGTGMCGSCRVKAKNKVKFCCVDGPDFDAHQIDFSELKNRLKQFEKQERIQYETKKN